jgi:molecular chaperone GrpE
MEEKELEKCHCENNECVCDNNCECEDCHCQDGECDCNHEECECGHDHEEKEHVHSEDCGCGHDHEHHDPRYEYIVALEKDLKEAEDKVLRLKAEMINYRKRMEEEQSRVYKYANEGMVKELLPIVDNFERAILMDDQDLTDEVSKFLTGFKMVYSDLYKVLKEHEVTVIEALNKDFDPNFHEAVLTEKSDKKSGTVIEVLQKGYIYKDKVIRPSMVKVSE